MIPLHEDHDPKTCVEWRQIEVPTEVLFHLQQRNRLHFGQAKGTPFAVPPLSDGLGFQGDGDVGEQILQGTYDTTDLDDNVALLIEHMKQSAEMAALESHPTVTEAEYTQKLKVWKESTSTSPSGLHLGHYKALISKHQYTDVEDLEGGDEDTEDEVAAKRDKWNHMQSTMLTLHVTMLNYALERGYSYTRWKTVVNTILFKDEDNVHLHRTRVIHIYEADYNLMLGIKWRLALYQAEAFRELHDGQYGSRPRRNAVDPVLIEELQFEISRASRKTFIQTNYDAMSCYDRIIPNVAMLVSRKYGVPKPITLSNAGTLEHAEYKIRTELGVSETGYTHDEMHPIYGTGQGSGNSPMIWCFLSSVLFTCYDAQASRAQYSFPDRTGKMSLGMIGFVDDSNGQNNAFQEDETAITVPALLGNMQRNAQLWSNLLGASGGALELSKCSSHVVSWQFASQGDPVLRNPRQLIPNPVPVTDMHTQEAHHMHFLSPYEAHKTLGHYKEPAGTQHSQFLNLKRKSDTSTEFLWKCQLTHLEAWTYYYACYLPSIGYPLSCSSLSRKQLDRIQLRAMSILVAKCGYNRNTKKAILYGPMEYGGASFRPLYVQQGVGQVTSFLRHWRQKSTTGSLLRCALAWTQMTAGTSYSIFQNVHAVLPHLESKWLASIRLFLATIDATMVLDDSSIPPLQRVHDFYLMDAILESRQFTPAQVRRLNFCRLYLQAVTVSDLTTAEGICLDPGKLHGEPSLMSSSTRYVLVHQERPSATEWRLWKKANRLWSNPEGELRQPLGKWLHPCHAQRNSHFAYYFRDRLAIRMHEGYQLYKCRHKRPILVMPGPLIPFASLPIIAHPVEVIDPDQGTCWQMSAPHGYYAPPPPSPFPATFDDFIAQLDAWEVDLLRHTQLFADPYSVCTALSQGFRSVSDGSVRYLTQGAFGWSLCSSGGERVASGMGPARGPRPTSYRAEAVGLLSILRLLVRLAEYMVMSEPWNGIIGTDSKSVLDTLSGKQPDGQRADLHEPVKIDSDGVVLDVLCPEWDVLIEIQCALQLLSGIKLQFVKGRQDAAVAVHRLPLLAQLNVEADALATIYQQDNGGDRPISYPLAPEPTFSFSQVQSQVTMPRLFVPNRGGVRSNSIFNSGISGRKQPCIPSIGVRTAAPYVNNFPKSSTSRRWSTTSSLPCLN